MMKNEWLEKEEKSLKMEMKKKMKRGTFKEAWGKYWMQYLALVLFAMALLYRSHAFGEEINYPISMFMHPRYCMNAEYDRCKTYEDKKRFHKENGDRCFNDAKNMCWWMPDMSMRDKSDYAFRNITILGCPGDPRSKLITALLTTLVQYGADCYEEWANINTKLHWAQYHYEMMELYQKIIADGGI